MKCVFTLQWTFGFDKRCYIAFLALVIYKIRCCILCNLNQNCN